MVCPLNSTQKPRIPQSEVSELFSSRKLGCCYCKGWYNGRVKEEEKMKKKKKVMMDNEKAALFMFCAASDKNNPERTGDTELGLGGSNILTLS